MPENSIVCLRYIHDPEWILFTKWTKEVREAYEVSHSKPETSQKHNIEPTFTHAMYEHVNLKGQTTGLLKKIYREGTKGTIRTKIFEHELLRINI